MLEYLWDSHDLSINLSMEENLTVSERVFVERERVQAIDGRDADDQ